METTDTLDFSLSFTYEEAKRASLSECSGKVSRGECIVLCGGSGSGKSTLLRTFNRLIPEFYDGELRGYARISGMDSDELSIGEAGKLASSVFQDPRSQFFTLSSTTEIAFGLENFGVPHDEMVRRVDEAFTLSGLERLRDRNVFELSSGERQLVAILAARAMDTDMLLLDEPTANLDYAAIENLRKVLLELKNEGKTIIISEHRLYYLSGLADQYWFMEKGTIKERFTSEEMLSLSDEDLLSRGLRTTDLSRVRNRSGKSGKTLSEHVFEAEDIHFSYRNTSKILDGMSVKAETGDVIGLVGPNGCGKTTFGKLVTGLMKKDRGTFLLDGVKMKEKDLTANSVFIMQEAEFQFFTNSVMNELTYGSAPTEERKEEIKRLLTELDMYQCRNQHPFSLSGGQMQKLVLLLAYLSPKPIAVLDEPTAGLDGESLLAAARLIEEMRKTKMVFIITHDPELLALSCTKALGMGKGKVREEYDLTTDEGLSKLRRFMETGLEPEERKIKREEKKGKLLDPRTKFFIVFFALAVGIFTDLTLASFTLVAVLIAASYERRWGIVSTSILSMALLFVLDSAFHGVATSFLLSFFPRVILMGAGAALLVQKSEAARSLSAMRRLHVPESWIMVFSVVFRFFPVLSKDIGMMNQSIRTRGFFPRFSDRVRQVPRCAEILIVPMVFRVMRIAEALSASAETRGIGLRNRRESFIELKLRPVDFIMAAITVLLVIAGLVAM